jgi:hypothetical protein
MRQVLLWLFVLFISCNISAQTNSVLFSREQRIAFAKWLESQGKWPDAGLEWKTIYTENGPDTAFLHYIKCLRFQYAYDSAYRAIFSIRDKDSMFGVEYEKNRILSGNLDDSDAIGLADASRLRFLSLLIQGKTALAKKYADTCKAPWRLHPDKDMLKLLKELRSYHPAKRGWATAMSAVIPGSGKLYAGHTMDGISAFGAVLGNAFMSARSFYQKGIRSFWGWFFGTLAAGYYAGNIYGTNVAVKRDAIRFTQKLSEDARQYTHTFFIRM